MHPYIAEFVGTAILVLFGNGVVANAVLARTKGNGGGWIVITAGWACAVALAVYVAARASGAHLNPAVTLGLASVGSFGWALVPGYLFAQMAGGFAGAVLVYLSYLAHWEPTTDASAKLACYCTGPAVRRLGAAFVTEFIGTAALVFAVLSFGRLAAGAPTEQQAWAAAVNIWFGPALVGILVFAIGLSLGGPTGYAINPARDLAPRLAHALLPIPGKGGSDWGYAWVPVIAPICGGIAGAHLFRLLGV
ncbi:MIP/aquaporin family protein [Opitutus sp. ER46]|uniref:MIP/aquaporin family protein n=1 Tax=Opitutus sp. ER46 TaxID=2161864 RepID=UPI000D3119AC|nr:MIP/aquaporin family protein [Opitutus sp. ER46]PTX96609.1 aquaporin [Opitutus sp. ER46]